MDIFSFLGDFLNIFKIWIPADKIQIFYRIFAIFWKILENFYKSWKNFAKFG